MLFTELRPQLPTPSFAHHHAPTKPSPLSPRRTSKPTTPEPTSERGPFNFAPPASTSNRHDKPATKYAERYATTVRNPLNAVKSSTSPSARDKRRDAFLNRVRHDREGARFENRGERFMLLEHVEERKAWGELMRRRADGIASGFGLLEEGDGEGEEGEELDEYIRHEGDLESGVDCRQSFSDDEYEALFMHLADGQGMDLSNG